MVRAVIVMQRDNGFRQRQNTLLLSSRVSTVSVCAAAVVFLFRHNDARHPIQLRPPPPRQNGADHARHHDFLHIAFTLDQNGFVLLKLRRIIKL